VKAAFSFRVPVPGLGAIPVNWLFLGLVGVASLALPPVLLLGAAGEIGLLVSLAGSSRFQMIVRSQRLATREQAKEWTLDQAVEVLSAGSQASYVEFRGKCQEILDFVARFGRIEEGARETYTLHLAELRRIYAKMLGLIEVFSRYASDWQRSDPLPEIAKLEKDLKQGEAPELLRKSREATLEVLKRRAQTREEISERSHVIQSELQRLEQEVALLRDQVILTRDPSVLSQSMDTASGLLEEHTNWVQENAALLQGLEEVSETV
jgi:hypothetical protein